MIPIKQTKLQSRTTNGNCMATAFASLLEINISDVPEFEEMFDVEDPDKPDQCDWFQKVEEWLFGLKLKIIRHHEDPCLNHYYLVSGNSPRGNFLHMVVFKSGKIVHDPHPDNTGINSFYDAWVLVPI